MEKRRQLFRYAVISGHQDQGQGCQSEPRHLYIFPSGLTRTNFLLARHYVIYAFLTMVFHGSSPKRLGSVPIYTSSYIASYITCIYFAVASKIIGMRPEYLTGL